MSDDRFALTLSILIVVMLIVGLGILGTCLPMGDVGASSSYRITYYSMGEGNPMFCTEEPYDPDDVTVIATGSSGFPCGATVRVCMDRCLDMVVQDRCGICSGRHVDVSEGAWKVLGQEDYGTVVEVGVVEAPLEAPPLPNLPLRLPSTGIGAR